MKGVTSRKGKGEKKRRRESERAKEVEPTRIQECVCGRGGEGGSGRQRLSERKQGTEDEKSKSVPASAPNPPSSNPLGRSSAPRTVTPLSPLPAILGTVLASAPLEPVVVLTA